MGAEYDVRILHPATGHDLVAVSDFALLHYVVRVNDVGAFRIELQGGASFLPTFRKIAQLDARPVVWRKPTGGHRDIDFAGFVRYWEARYRGGDVFDYVLTGPCCADVLDRRIIACDAGSSQADKSGHADDVMKEYVDENLGSSAAAGRDITDYGFSIQADLGAGTNVEKSASRDELLVVLREIARASYETAATAAFFGIVPLGNGYDVEFRTRTGQWGQDHRYPDGADGPVWFALERGNVARAASSTDRREEINFVYAAGRGREADREVIELSDTARIGASPLNRREALFDGGNYETAGLTSAGKAKLEGGRPARTFTFEANDVEGTRYGTDYGLGDRVTATLAGEQRDFHVAAASVKVKGKEETVKPIFEEWPR